MTAADRLRQTRAALGAATVARALLWGAVTAAGIALLLALVPYVVRDGGVPAPYRRSIAFAVGAAVALAIAARRAPRLTPERVALWIEERTPALDYALVTLAGRPERGVFTDLLEQRVARATWSNALARATVRALAAPAALLAVLLLVHGAAARTGSAAGAGPAGAAGRAAGAPNGRERASALAALRVVVAPPSYARGRTRELRDPASVTELVGGSVVVHGPTAGRDVDARLGRSPLRVLSEGERWRVALAMPARAAALTLRDGPRSRMIVLEPRADSAPVVALTAPARDTIFRAPVGRVALAATASDDVGLARGGFEYIVSSGSGESFTFRSGRLGDRALGSARAATLGATIDLAALALKPGDVLHVRAVAADGNTVGGPSLGTSETRTLRVARVGEYDSLAVEAAGPPVVDKSLVSQRMLIMLTEALERRRPRLAREELVRESRRIAADQAKLRKAVSDIVFTRLGDQPLGEHSHFEGDGHDHGDQPVAGPLTPEQLLDAANRATGTGAPGALEGDHTETPVVAVNKPLLEAYNEMWDAGRELEAAEPARALPPMRRALAAIQRARQAERVYLRGRPPAVVVDVGRARLQGTDKGAGSVRQPRAASDDPVAQLGARLTSALALLGAAPAAAVDSLTLLRVDALGTAPALAAALGEALDQIRAGRDATQALVRARRVAGIAPSGANPLGAWGQR